MKLKEWYWIIEKKTLYFVLKWWIAKHWIEKKYHEVVTTIQAQCTAFFSRKVVKLIKDNQSIKENRFDIEIMCEHWTAFLMSVCVKMLFNDYEFLKKITFRFLFKSIVSTTEWILCFKFFVEIFSFWSRKRN